MMVVVHDLLVVVLTWILLRWLAGLAGAPPRRLPDQGTGDRSRDPGGGVLAGRPVSRAVALRQRARPDQHLAGAAVIGMLLIVVVLMVAGMLVAGAAARCWCRIRCS